MPKLRSLAPRTGELGQRVQRLDNNYDEGRRSRPWRKWYNTKRWRDLRWGCLVKGLFTCVECHTTISDTSQLVADHKEAHRGDPKLFWDPENLQCMCKRCHDTIKQRAEARRG